MRYVKVIMPVESTSYSQPDNYGGPVSQGQKTDFRPPAAWALALSAFACATRPAFALVNGLTLSYLFCYIDSDIAGRRQTSRVTQTQDRRTGLSSGPRHE